MDEQELRAQLEAILRPKNERMVALMRERAAKEMLLSDEEWWESRQESLAQMPFMSEMPEQFKSQMIEMRHQRYEHLKGDLAEKMVADEANKLMPVIIATREVENKTGPLTEDEYTKASIRYNQLIVDPMSARFADAALKELNPQKQELLRRLSENIKSDSEDLKLLCEPGVTEEQLQDVTQKIVERMTKLTESLHRNGDEGDS